MEDFAEFARVSDVLRERNRRKKAIVVPNEIRQLRFFDRLHHRLSLLPVERERLLAEDHLAVLDARERDFHVRVVWRADVDGVDIFARDEFPPIGLDRARIPPRRKLAHLRLISPANSL